MDKEKGEINIKWTERNEFFEFCIIDNGPDIRKEDRQRIFKMFEKETGIERADSSGIGLAIIKRNIEENGGKIWLQSTIGEGSAFYFTIPK